MKRLSLIIPLTLVPFLMGCGNKQIKLTKEEFDYANSLVDIENLQMNDTSIWESSSFSFSNGEGRNTTCEKYDLTPSVNHYISTKEEESENKVEPRVLHEEYQTLDGASEGHCLVAELDSEEWSVDEEDIENYYRPTAFTPTAMLSKTFSMFTTIEPELKYENFKFNGSGYLFEGTGRIDLDYFNANNEEALTVPIKIEFHYENKKISKATVDFTISYGNEGIGAYSTKINQVITYDYKNVIPVWPIQPEN